jgi:hypothetical protein
MSAHPELPERKAGQLLQSMEKVSNFIQTPSVNERILWSCKASLGDSTMLNPWFDITFQAARLGFEAQNAAALQLMRLLRGTSKAEVRGMVADKIAAPPDVPAAAAPPVVQAAATKLASDGARRRESVNKVHKKRSRANRRKRSK